MRPLVMVLVLGLVAPEILAQFSPAKQTPANQRAGLLLWKSPIPDLPRPEELQSFDTSSVRLDWRNQRWLVTYSGGVLKDFGPSERAARQAVQVIHELTLNQRGTIGAGSLEYWLSNGQPPRRTPQGLATVSLEPASLRVAGLQGRWYLRNQSRLLVDFGGSEADARQALAIMQKYRFDRVGIIGSGEGAMAVFLAPLSENLRAGHHSNPTAHPAGNRLVPPQVAKPTSWPGQQPSSNPAAQLQGLDQLPHRLIGGSPNTAVTRVPFDWRQVALVQVNGDWQLRAGMRTLVNFGPHSTEAQQGLQALRYYRFTELHQLASTGASYFTAPKAAPHALPAGLHGEDFRPEQLEIKQTGGVYSLCQKDRVILQLGSQESEARQVLDSIKRDRFDRVCRIGKPGQETMTFLLRTR